MVSVLIALSILCLLAWRYTHQKQNLRIKNMAHNGYEISYFTTAEGQLLQASSYLGQQQTTVVEVESTAIWENTKYDVAIGNHKLGQAYCKATIVQPAFGKQAKFTQHQGHCHTYQTPDGELSLVVSDT